MVYILIYICSQNIISLHFKRIFSLIIHLDFFQLVCRFFSPTNWLVFHIILLHRGVKVIFCCCYFVLIFYLNWKSLENYWKKIHCIKDLTCFPSWVFSAHILKQSRLFWTTVLVQPWDSLFHFPASFSVVFQNSIFLENYLLYLQACSLSNEEISFTVSFSLLQTLSDHFSTFHAVTSFFFTCCT